jgi:hypothetical protein
MKLDVDEAERFARAVRSRAAAGRPVLVQTTPRNTEGVGFELPAAAASGPASGPEGRLDTGAASAHSASSQTPAAHHQGNRRHGRSSRRPDRSSDRACLEGRPRNDLVSWILRDRRENGDEFRPERWLEGSRSERISDDWCFPFSAGPRICPGRGFPIPLGTLFLAAVAQRWTLERITEQPRPFVFWPLGGPWMVKGRSWMTPRARPTSSRRL